MKRRGTCYDPFLLNLQNIWSWKWRKFQTDCPRPCIFNIFCILCRKWRFGRGHNNHTITNNYKLLNIKHLKIRNIRKISCFYFFKWTQVTVQRFCFLAASSSNKLNKQEQIQQNNIILCIFIVVICQVLNKMLTLARHWAKLVQTESKDKLAWALPRCRLIYQTSGFSRLIAFLLSLLILVTSLNCYRIWRFGRGHNNHTNSNNYKSSNIKHLKIRKFRKISCFHFFKWTQTMI